jgi:CBS domain-containing protein
MAARSGSLPDTKTLGDIMRPDSLVTVDQDATVLEAARAMAARSVRIVGVLEGNRFVGVFSERDVVRRVVARELDAAHTRVGDVMTGGVVAADAGDACLVTLRRMEEAGIGHVPVMVEGHVLSMVSIRDLLQIEGARPAGARGVKGLAEI